MINKGFVSTIVDDGKKAIVIPQEANGTTTIALVIPYFLLECLEINMPVVYATFEDNTGIILSRLDGEWNHKIYETLTIKGVTHMTDKLTADNGITATGGISSAGGGDVQVQGDITLMGSMSVGGNVSANGDVTAANISLSHHIHGGVEKGNFDTQTQK